MTDSIESRGKSVEDAVAEALLRLGARKDEVRIEVLDEGRPGLLGLLGARQARVRVTRKAAGGGGPGRRESQAREGRQGREGREGRDGREGREGRGESAGRGRGRGSEGRSGERRERAQPSRGDRRAAGRERERDEPRERQEPGVREVGREEAQERAGRSGGRRGRGGRGGRGAGVRGRYEDSAEAKAQVPAQPEPVAAAAVEGAQAPDSGAAPVEGLRREPGLASAAGEASSLPFGEEVQADSLVAPLGRFPLTEAPRALEKLAGELMRRGGFPCRCEVKEGEYNLVKIITDEQSAAVLIGRHGATIDAIEHLVERMADQGAGEHVHLNLDINNYRRRREERLVQRAQEAAQRVRAGGGEEHFEPMGARERRIVHLEVAKVDGLATYTVAGEEGKHVVVTTAAAMEGATSDAAAGGAEGDEAPRQPQPAPQDGGAAAV